MLQVKKLVQLNILLLVLISGLLLGMSLGSWRMTLIAVIGAILGYLSTDYFRLLRIEGVIANTASIAILFLAMKDFLPEDSTGKLISVANLLVYLQTVLMFQEKTPRLIWQILVLSLLEVVLAAIFSLNFEGGLLFLLYFAVAGTAMLLQIIYNSNLENLRNNQVATRRLGFSHRQVTRYRLGFDSGYTSEWMPPLIDQNADRQSSRRDPILFFVPKPRDTKTLRQMLLHLSLWMGVILVFTFTMFYMVPRHTKPWFGPNKIEVTSLGLNKSVDLVNTDQIKLNHDLIFRASFEVFGNIESKLIASPPYFRGMALSSLVIEDNKTNWKAPHDRLHDEVYQSLARPRRKGVPVKQTITLEETIDPLVYAVMPVFRTADSTQEMEFCHEISALTRCRVNQKIDLAPFQYELTTFADRRGNLCQAWPYLSNTADYHQLPMAKDPPQQEWLTEIEKSRYPRLVKIADSLAERARERNPNITRRELIREFEEFFLEPNRFRYTLDFREVRWSPNLDPVEDFVQNIRKGHCELFASALTLMLRSQGIPSRLVVGFHGGDYNAITKSYMVRGRHAHAWVEAYLRPEDCTPEMEALGESGPGGAWLLVDPTPATADLSTTSGGSGPIDIARTIWQDYVLGMENNSIRAETYPVSLPIFGILEKLDVANWDFSYESWQRSLSGPMVRNGVVFLLGLGVLAYWILRTVPDSNRDGEFDDKKNGMLRRFVANAISLLSPSLAQWVMVRRTGKSNPTAFYQRMSQVLQPIGLQRRATQTHREFANEVNRFFAEHPAGELIGSTVREITELFNDVRFGKQELPVDLLAQIDISIKELQQSLELESRPGENQVHPDETLERNIERNR